jgi:small-conductance mechanosensitive channel
VVTDRFSELTTYIVPTAVALAGLVLGLVARRTVLGAFARVARRSTWKYDDVLVEALRGPVVAWCTLAGLSAAVALLRLPAAPTRVLDQVLLVLAILSVTWAAARFTVRALRTGASDGALPSVSLIANVAAAGIYFLGALVVLERLGISVTPIITALGVGGLAVALALQDTLSNLFAGVRILAAGKLRPGDFVRLESGQEGYVQDITWAQTTILQQPNNLVIVPNVKLATAITVNYDLPSADQAFTVPVSVARGSDLARVERVALEVAREVQREVEGAVSDFEPLIRFQGYGQSSVDFLAILRSARYDARFLLIHEFVRRIDARFAAEGIEIPFPVRTVLLDDRRRGAEGP